MELYMKCWYYLK